jgi:hypothetical protein
MLLLRVSQSFKTRKKSYNAHVLRRTRKRSLIKKVISNTQNHIKNNLDNLNCEEIIEIRLFYWELVLSIILRVQLYNKTTLPSNFWKGCL